MEFKDRLIGLRESKGLSQYQISEQLGIKRPRYNAWEQGISMPRTDMVNKLADFFEVNPNYLLGFDSKIPDWATPKDVHDFKTLLEEDSPIMFDGVPISKDDKEKIKRVMEAMFWDAKKKNKETYGRKKKKTDE
ncbi:helix-turn-helix transcriptional regulator [Paenibacillus sp. FSL H8-0261]|uniref:helix-turn-helix domain-containing protein n=1 Tax=Paenibacillus sp. FSL H8-0261 TaxID=2921381 RepID=UPI0032566080